MEVTIKQESSDEDVSSSQENEDVPKIETKPEDISEHTFSGNWSDEDNEPLSNLKDDFEFHPPSPEGKKKQLPRRVRAKIFREKLTGKEM